MLKEQRPSWLSFFLLLISWNNIFFFTSVCMYVHVCGHMCKYMPVEATWGWCWEFSQSLSTLLTEAGSLIWALEAANVAPMIMWLVLKIPHLSLSICPPNTYMGNQIWPSCFHGKLFKPPSYLSSSLRKFLTTENNARSSLSNCQWRNKLIFLPVDFGCYFHKSRLAKLVLWYYLGRWPSKSFLCGKIVTAVSAT